MSSYSYLFKFIVIGDTSTFALMSRRREVMHPAPVPIEKV